MTVIVSCAPRENWCTITGYAQGGTYAVKADLSQSDIRPRELKDSVEAILSAIDKSGEFPSDETVAKTLASSGMDRLVPDMQAVLDSDGMLDAHDLLLPGKGSALPKLNFNAVAQGYSSDLVASFLKKKGEIYCQGHNPQGKSWTLGIDRPLDGNNTPGADLQGIFHAPSTPCGIVTSGNYRNFYIRDGKKYAHTVDPKTGYPVSHQLLSATVVAPDSFTADALATYCMVIGPEAAKAFVLSRNDIEACLIFADGDSTSSWCSEGFVLEKQVR